MSVYVVPYSVTFLKFVPALIAVLVLAAATIAFRASQRWLMTKPLHRREASNWLSATALGLFVLFIFLISLLSMPARAEAKLVKAPQKTQRVVRDVTPLFAAADTQQFSARKKRYAKKRYAKRWRHRVAPSYAGGADLNVMTPTERAEYYQRGGQHYSVSPQPHRRVARRSGRAPVDANANSVQTNTSLGLSVGGGGLVATARAYLGTNPTGRRSLWCGDFMAMIAPSAAQRVKNPRMARAWADDLPRVSAQVGAIAVLRRGLSGGHIGVVTGFDSAGNPVIVSGNHNRVVGEGVYPRSRVIAYVAGS